LKGYFKNLKGQTHRNEGWERKKRPSTPNQRSISHTRGLGMEVLLRWFECCPESHHLATKHLLIRHQKTDKYKRKYRGNIFIGKFLRDFTDGTIPTELRWEKKLKQSKKNDDVSVFTNGITDEINSIGKFHR
jgi:hypothetical protein